MTFLAMIVALVLLQIWGSDNPVQSDDWFQRLKSSIEGIGLPPALGLVVYCGIPLVVASFLLDSVDSWLFGLVWIVGAVIILLYAFGRERQQEFEERYRQYCMNGDFEAAHLFLQSMPAMPGEAFRDIQGPRDVHELFLHRLVYLGYQRWFAVLFYFLLFGPLGALAYRLLQLSQPEEREMSVPLLHYVDWVPARLLAMVFTLAGDFMGSRDELQRCLSEPEMKTDKLLLQVGRAAIGSSAPESQQDAAQLPNLAVEESGELAALLGRSATAWVVAISLLVLLV